VSFLKEWSSVSALVVKDRWIIILRTLNIALLDLSSGFPGVDLLGETGVWILFLAVGWLSFAPCDGTAEFDPTYSLVLFVWDPRLGKQGEGKSAESP
jgi:hypothetical protein